YRRRIYRLIFFWYYVRGLWVTAVRQGNLGDSGGPGYQGIGPEFDRIEKIGCMDEDVFVFAGLSHRGL
ncbi:MAG: hypothetical protein ABFD66_00135, partial [Smithella sp.]